MSLSPKQIETIKSTVPVLQAHGKDITLSFYATLLREHPELNNIFNHANQRSTQQAGALANSLYAVANHISDLGAISPALEKINQKHASLFIRPEQYDIVGEYLLRAMGDVLGGALTPEILEAWKAAYGVVAGLMIKREEYINSQYAEWKDWRDFRIARKVSETEEITSFFLEPVDGKPLPTFLPGQYISVLVDVPKFGYLQSRQYSLSDAPRTDYYRISVKKESGHGSKSDPGFLSNVLHNDKNVGDTIRVGHPAGEFSLDPEKDTAGPVVLLSAGVGITPMISILNTLIERSDGKRRISFVHGARTLQLQAFRKHINDVAGAHKNVTACICIKTPDVESDVPGLDYRHAERVQMDVLDKSKDLCLDDEQTTYYVCGPEGFMVDMDKGLKGVGVKQERIRMEVFGIGNMGGTCLTT